MYERKHSLQSKQLIGVKNDALDCCNMSILRKRVKANSKIKQQQQQKLITSETFRFNKLNNEVKIASDKTETKQNNL